MIPFRFAPVLVVALCLISTTPAFARTRVSAAAQQAADAKKKQEQQQEEQQEQQRRAAEQAQVQAVNAAQKSLDDAQAALNAVTLKAETQFESSPEYIAANNELKADQAAYDAAAGTVATKADADPAFASAKARSDKLEAELADMKAGGVSSDDEIVAKSQEVMQASSATHKIETDAVAADPAATAAHEKLIAAQKTMDALKADFHAKLSKTPDYAAAKSAVDAADQQLIAAQRGEGRGVPAVATTVKGKITGVGNDSFTMAVSEAKKKSRIVTVKYTSGATITGPASGTIDKTAIGQTASVVGKETGNTISASSITISGTPKKSGAA